MHILDTYFNGWEDGPSYPTVPTMFLHAKLTFFCNNIDLFLNYLKLAGDPLPQQFFFGIHRNKQILLYHS